MTKELMIKAIYEKIADKTLSFGCKYNHTSEMYFVGFISHGIAEFDRAYGVKLSKSDIKRNIIGHPVMIGDVLDYIENLDYLISDEDKIFFLLDWEHKRKPIEEQSEDTIKYIYNLIK